MTTTQARTALQSLPGLTPANGPLAQLQALTAYRAAVEALIAETVVAARADKRDGTLIGSTLGVSKQAARERYSKLAPAAPNAGPEAIRVAILAAYARLRPADDEWVGLASLRAELTEFTREDVDAALWLLAKERGVHIIPVANLKSLTQADRDAALLLGGQYSHAIGIER